MSKYTPEQIKEFAEKQKCTPEQFTSRWIIQTTTGHYFLYGENGYMTPVRQTNLPVAMRDHLVRAKGIENGVKITYMKTDANGGTTEVNRKVEDILHDHSTVANEITGSMTIPHSYFDAKTVTFYERLCPQRDLEPVFDANIDKWIRLLGGKKAEKLLDWVATVGQLDHKTCALYLHGAKDVGKTIFAAGLSRIWSLGPTKLDSIISSFNSLITDCPLIFADERIPKELDSGTLRAIVGSDSISVRRKNLPEKTIPGCVRLIIAANNPDLLKFSEEDFRKEDVDAIASRFLYIQCSDEAADFLKELGGQKGATAGWISEDKIACHALWLAKNRKVQPGENKFIVSGEIESFHRRLATNGTIRGIVVEWICRALLGEIYWANNDKENVGIRFGHGKLYVNSAFVRKTWERTLDDRHVPTVDKIGKALKPLSTGEKRLPITKSKPESADKKTVPRRVDFFDIDVEHVYRLAEELQLGTREEFQEIIESKDWNWSPADGSEAPGATAEGRGLFPALQATTATPALPATACSDVAQRASAIANARSST